MTPIKTITTTRTLTAPPDWPAEKLGPCVDLPITEANGTMFSYWRPSPEELAQLAAGMPLRLGIVGRIEHGHPAVSIEVEV